ncbi:SGNH hydrolase [Hypomontagnella monticulosa]|nr:SGNH hydrolase [Hypomontagnella monticulosa]
MSRKTLRVLCLGDSLTSGYPVGQPYGYKLQDELESAFLGHGYSEVEVVDDGDPGELVTKGSFTERMEDRWKGKSSFDWTIVLGGTNDLGWDYDANKIFPSLKQLWDIPLSKGGKVLALTVPDARARYGNIKDRRDELNKLIMEYKKPNFFHFDLYNALPYHNMERTDRPKYWQMDGLHLTADGYDLMGAKIAAALIRIIKLAEAQETDISSIAKDPRQRQAIEDMIYEEERGNPRLLSQGYIVVRKSDLD